jgi:transposase
MSQWACAQVSRQERTLLGPCLDEQIGRDHGIRVLEAMLLEVDWASWEAAYACEGAGRPPIHPRLMAGAILYGLIKRLRSTRDLEDATRMRFDFRWLLECRTIDHTTFAVFRNRFEKQIGDLFASLNRRAAEVRKSTLEEILIDGTRLRADSNRHGSRTGLELQKKLGQLETEMREALRRIETDDQPGGEPATRGNLEQQLKRLDTEREKVAAALLVAKERDAKKREKDGAKATAVRVPVTDPDAYVMPNKEGGYAPNYTPVVAVDSRTGLIVAAGMAEGNAEAESVPALMEQVKELAGETLPQRVLFDGGFGAGPNLQTLSDAGVEVYSPVGCSRSENPAVRPDPSLPVEVSARDQLPRRGDKLDKAAFVYDPVHDQYVCPMGRPLPPHRSFRCPAADGSDILSTEYLCTDCSDCPLSCACLSRKANARTIVRDRYEPLREALRTRMQSEAGRKIYARRAPAGEGVFAQIKSSLGIRRFMRRGLAKVKADWLWICTAHNLMKMLRHTALSSSPQAEPTPSSRFRRRLYALRTAILAAIFRIFIPRPFSMSSSRILALP